LKRGAATIGGIAIAGAVATGAIGLFIGNSWANLVDKTKLSYFERKAH